MSLNVEVDLVGEDGCFFQPCVVFWGDSVSSSFIVFLLVDGELWGLVQMRPRTC